MGIIEEFILYNLSTLIEIYDKKAEHTITVR